MYKSNISLECDAVAMLYCRLQDLDQLLSELHILAHPSTTSTTTTNNSATTSVAATAGVAKSDKAASQEKVGRLSSAHRRTEFFLFNRPLPML